MRSITVQAGSVQKKSPHAAAMRREKEQPGKMQADAAKRTRDITPRIPPLASGNLLKVGSKTTA